jgi:hypothetical protein
LGQIEAASFFGVRVAGARVAGALAALSPMPGEVDKPDEIPGARKVELISGVVAQIQWQENTSFADRSVN